MKYSKNLDANEILELIFIYLTEVTSLRKHDDILMVLADMGRALTSADRCTVWLVSDDKKKIWTKVAHGMEPIEIPIDSGIVGTAIKNSQKIMIDDVYEDERFNSDVDKITGYSTKSMMVIPMFNSDAEIIGAFQAINSRSEKGVFDNGDMQRLMLASTYAAETLASAKLTQEIEETQREVVFTMGAIGESRSKETAKHVKRVAEYSRILATDYGLPKEQERKIMDTHAELGYSMTNNSERPLLKAASIVAYEHHEKYNAKGYPQGKSGEDIHIYGRITAIADVFDALQSDRVYKKAWDDEKILKLFKEERGEHFDPTLIDLFFENIDKFFEVRDAFKDNYIGSQKKEEDKSNKITVLGAFGTKAKGFGTSSFYLNKENVIDAGNLLYALEEESAKIENIWITHSHLDHISDIAYIIDNYYASIDKTINICGLPATINAIQKHFLNDLIWPDFSKIPLPNKNGMCVKYTEIELDKEYVLSENESIRAFKTDHTVPSCGYVYKKDNSAVLITADTYSLENALNIVNNDKTIKSIVLECSFPSHMEMLAKESKHLTPKLLAEMLEGLKRDDVNLYINHIKPSFIEEIIKEIGEYCAKWKPKIVKDGEIINF